MINLWSALASLIEGMAKMGAGAASCGATSEPEVPEELRK